MPPFGGPLSGGRKVAPRSQRGCKADASHPQFASPGILGARAGGRLLYVRLGFEGEIVVEFCGHIRW